jgi:very-short-patch-repair endonuclease
MPTDEEAPTTTPPDDGAVVAITASLVSRLNLADFENSVPALRDLAVSNGTGAPLQGLVLSARSEPAFLKPRTWHIDAVGPGEIVHLRDLDLGLDGGLLARLTEAEKATVVFTLARQGATSPVCEHEVVVELLPRNQWGGIGQLPEMVAAFVQPNDPAVDRVLKTAAGILERNGRSHSIEGYQNGPARAWELASAIWSAVVAMRLDYALPPASFEHVGQKVRGPSHIADTGLATCLDLSLLFAACLEQAHLNPLLVFLKGHVFAGVWLRAEEFATPVVDDVTALRKRVQLKEMLLFETTLAAQRPTVAFPRACDDAFEQIAHEDRATFELAVDIRRARMKRIRPLASAEAVVARAAAPPVEDSLPEFAEAPELPETEDSRIPAADLDLKDRLARWQRRLLDLSLRNALLNFRPGKKTIPIVAPEPATLEDLLADGQVLKLLPHPVLMDGADPRSRSLHEAREQEDLRKQHAIDALSKRELFVPLVADDMTARLTELYRTARTAMQEGGANTLFLALGFLTWNRDDKPDHRVRAPLILLPVTLSRRSARSGFTITAHEDEPRVNPTLLEMLRQDFHLDLGLGDGSVPRDDAGIDVSAIWRRVAQAVKDIKGWEVSEDVTLAMFSFAKFLMWKDLTERTDQLRRSPVVKHLIDTPREVYHSSVDFPDPRRLDVDFSPNETLCPLPADSSQLSAVMAAVRGKDFVLIGPPGTGKSQTISNVIAQCVAEGKRVLFVAEKIAALNVVHRRLRAVGLADFCLELHSNKAHKLDVVRQLEKSWSSRGTVDQSAWEAEARRLATLRDQLSTYVQRLHHRHENGWTIHGAIGCVVAGEARPLVRLGWSSASAHGSADMASLREVTTRVEVNATAVGMTELGGGALADVRHTEWSPTWQQGVFDASEALSSAARRLQQTYVQFAQSTGLPTHRLGGSARAALSELAKLLPSAHGYDWGFLAAEDAASSAAELRTASNLLRRHRELNAGMSPPWSTTQIQALSDALLLLAERDQIHAGLGVPWSSFVAEQLQSGLQLLEELERHRAALSVDYTSKIDGVDVTRLLREWNEAEQSLWPLSWVRTRKIRQQLKPLIEGTGEPRVADDLATWVSIRALRDQVRNIPTVVHLEGVWAGLKTHVEAARSALRANVALESARSDRAWSEAGLEAAADGRCGDRWAMEVTRLRQLKELDARIDAMASDFVFTNGLWAGRHTHRDHLRAAISFETERLSLTHSGSLIRLHPVVADGRCGPSLQAQHERLSMRAAVEVELGRVADLSGRTGGLWRGLETDVCTVDAALDFHQGLAPLMTRLGQCGFDDSHLRSALRSLISDRNELLAPAAAVTAAGAAFVDACVQVSLATAALADLCVFDSSARQQWLDADAVALCDRADGLAARRTGLHKWCAWRKARTEAVAAGLATLVEAVERGLVLPEHISSTFEVNYCRWWLSAAVENEFALRTFVSAEHERRIGDFRALDDKFTELTQQWIRARLCATLPLAEMVQRSSEWGVLRNEIVKKKRHLPLRELMSRIPNVVRRLTPCLLMSPLSIAQYLTADVGHFDVVVFDEASQIPVWDAIGAMARGRQVVMVGDPKQLPPTNFFDRGDADAGEDDVEADLESVLDECLGAGLPRSNLNWHYRSRHESLIAFSNARYYGGGLVTFPSPVTDDTAVSFHHVKGVYEKGGARINKAEARALVADLVARLKSRDFRDSGLTIGVVTFNAEQQALIEDLLDDARRLDPSLEPHFSDDELEPVFVKNLESVQGDERDIMYFSITYGPDAAGSVSMNFGPLNRDGGERRLNVAVTRARHQLRVFSSLTGDQMDLSRTRASGVQDLKHFLEFAQRGPRALAEATMGSRGDFESPFEEGVAAALSRKGWEVRTQIGVSAFRVDLGVVHPDMPGRYLAGVECDGATYHRAATARDRDKLREQILRGLGWTIVRVWSTDWWIDPQGTLEEVHARLNATLEAERLERATKREDCSTPVPPAQASVDFPHATVTPVNHEDEEGFRYGLSTVAGGAEVARESMFDYADNRGMARPLGTFVEANPLDVLAPARVSAGRFFDPTYDVVLTEMIRHIVTVEGPVLDAVLARRVARAHGFGRTGSRIQERVDRLAFGQFATTREEDAGTFYWPQDVAPGSPVSFRRPLDDSSARGVEEICLQELASLASAIRAQGLSGEAAMITMARQVGLLRLRAASRGRLEAALALPE